MYRPRESRIVPLFLHLNLSCDFSKTRPPQSKETFWILWNLLAPPSLPTQHSSPIPHRPPFTPPPQSQIADHKF